MTDLQPAIDALTQRLETQTPTAMPTDVHTLTSALCMLLNQQLHNAEREHLAAKAQSKP